ncbi:alpha/beta hydrolase family protein [Actinokineospora iranica]|uniref:Predicted alpha/beta hydrolase n=1 Tax=Actinokineospora iranica TaxID=1271860 RepID=A0A1G6U226_9PSEU|nr:alpha/beta fold hydrolase [Actinokineospora iranica]SDD34736.1 Predicted alpha/beta hydrolase [Actinokineospora iranica]
MSVSHTGRGAAGSRPPSEFTTLESLRVETGDGTAFTLRLLPSEDASAPVVLILPAMAVKAKFYLPLAKALRAAGLSVATCDLRGQGESTPALREGPDFGYRELIEVDLPAIVAAVTERFPDRPLHLLGHSLGGQLALLFSATNPGVVAGVSTIGTGTVFWRAFGPKRWFEALWKIQWIGLVSKVKGWWPGGVLIPGAMAGGVMIDWARHSRTSRYRPKGTNVGYDAALAKLDIPVLLISLERDILGPKSNVDFLGERLESARLANWHIAAGAGVANLDHFGWVKDSAVIGPAVATWITERTLPGAPA